MQFNYQDIDTINLFGYRWYVTPYGNMPSITTVLGISQDDDKKAALQKYKEYLGDREKEVSEEILTHGTNVHLLAELFLKGETPNKENFSEDDIGAFNSIKHKLKKIKPIGQELAVYSNELGVAGRFDCVGIYNDELCIIDFKTSNKIKSKHQIDDYRLQMAFYAHAHNEMFGSTIKTGYIIMAAERGFPQEFKFDLSDISDLKKRINRAYIELERNCSEGN